MNWDRVKTAFIILLVVCNAVLFYVYIDSDRKEDNMDEKDLEIKVEKIFEKNDINIEEISKPDKTELPIIKVSEKNISFNDEKEKFIDLGLKPYSEKEGSGYIFTYTFEGVFEVEYYGDSSSIKSGDYQTAIKVADKFIEFKAANIKFEYNKYEKNEDGSYKIYYEQSYDGIRIVDGYIIIVVKGDKVLSLNERVLNLIEDSERSQKLIPYSLALYELYAVIEPSDCPMKFLELDLVQELKTAYDDEGLVSGETFAYYRFTNEKGKRYLIKAIESSKNK